jgi:uncharacterized protein YggU (UPF0235/DUF167 family)
MIIHVKARPGSSSEGIKQISQGMYEASVKEMAKKGKANLALIKLIAGYFGVSSSKVKIKGGLTSKNKILEIQNDKI